MTTYSRNGYKWSVNETLSLQREYELLEWSIDKIAQKHKRSNRAIMYKLSNEGFADYNELCSYYNSSNENCENLDLSVDNYNDNVDEPIFEPVANIDTNIETNKEVAYLTERLNSLDKSLNEIKNMLRNNTTNQNIISLQTFT